MRADDVLPPEHFADCLAQLGLQRIETPAP